HALTSPAILLWLDMGSRKYHAAQLRSSSLWIGPRRRRKAWGAMPVRRMRMHSACVGGFSASSDLPLATSLCHALVDKRKRLERYHPGSRPICKVKVSHFDQTVFGLDHVGLDLHFGTSPLPYGQTFQRKFGRDFAIER